MLWAGRGATLTLSTAAYLWGLTERQPPMIALAVPAHRSVVRVPGTRIRRRRHLETTVVRRLPVTSVAQTIVDLTDEPGCTAAESVAWAARACQQGKSRAPDLLDELARRRAHRHRGALRVALGDIGDGVESVAEQRYVNDVERAHGLPTFDRQSPARSGDGDVRRDFESLEFGVVVEIDGQLWHSGPAFRSDRLRDRQAAADGKVTLRAGWVDVTEAACDLAADIVRTLWQRGWSGHPRPCSIRCAVARLGQGSGA